MATKTAASGGTKKTTGKAPTKTKAKLAKKPAGGTKKAASKASSKSTKKS